MLVSLGFLLVIVLMSAFLAVLADNVGRKLGKSRRSLKTRHFSMRPKHVAQVGTAMTGVLVSLATIGVVALVSKDVRDWIVRGRNAIAQAESLQHRNQVLADQIRTGELTVLRQTNTIASQKVEIGRREAEVRSRTREVELGKIEIRKQHAAAQELQAQIGRLRTEIPRLRSEIARGQSDIVRATQRLVDTQRNFASVRSQLQSVNLQLRNVEALKRSAVTQKGEIDDQNTRLLAANGELERQQTQLESRIRSLRTSRDELEAARDEAVAKLALTQTELDARQTDLNRVQLELKSTEQRLATATLDSYRYFAISSVSRTAPLTFRLQEEVARLAVKEGLSQSQAEAAMAVLLRSARLAAIKRGAKPNDEYPEAGIFERRDPQTRETVSGAELERRLVTQIAGSRQPLILVAYSSLNAFRGEPVSLDVLVYPNPIVYRAGQLVAEARVDGRKDDDEIYRQVAEFVNSRLQDRARQDRLIPMAGTEAAYITVPVESILHIVSDVKSAERTVRLLALASNDTRVGDVLKVNFQVR